MDGDTDYFSLFTVGLHNPITRWLGFVRHLMGILNLEKVLVSNSYGDNFKIKICRESFGSYMCQEISWLRDPECSPSTRIMSTLHKESSAPRTILPLSETHAALANRLRGSATNTFNHTDDVPYTLHGTGIGSSSVPSFNASHYPAIQRAIDSTYEENVSLRFWSPLAEAVLEAISDTIGSFEDSVPHSALSTDTLPTACKMEGIDSQIRF